MASQQRKGPFNFDLKRPQRTGYMLKQGRYHRIFKRRFFVLYPGFLVYYDDDIKWKSDLAKGDTLGGRIGAVYLKNSTCKTAKNAPKGCRFGFCVEAPDPRNRRPIYLMNANDKHDRDAWIEKVRCCTPKTPRNSPKMAQRTKHETAHQHPVIAVRQETVDDAALVGSVKAEEDNDQVTDLNDVVPEIAVRHDTADSAALLGSNSSTETSEGAVTSFDDELLNRVLSRDESEQSNDSDAGSDVEADSGAEKSESGSENGSVRNGTDNGKDAEAVAENGTESVHKDEHVEERIECNGNCSEAREVDCDTASKTNENGEVEVTVTVTVLPDNKALPETKTTAEVLSSESETKELHDAEPDSKSESEKTASGNRSETDEKPDTKEPHEAEPDSKSEKAEIEKTSENNDKPAEVTNGESKTQGEGDDSDTSSTSSSSSDEAEHSPIRQANDAVLDAPTITIEKADTLKKKEETEDDTLPDNLVVAAPKRRGSVPFVEKRGFLYKMGGKRKSWKLRYFILQPGAFSYYKNNPNSKPIGTVKLKNLQIFFPGVGERKQSFQFTVHTESQWNSRNDWVMAAVNEKEMKEWIESFKSAAAIDTSAGN